MHSKLSYSPSSGSAPTGLPSTERIGVISAAVPQPLAAADGSFNAATEALTGTVNTGGLAPGRHIVYVRARDAAGAWGPVSAVFLNIVSPLPLPVNEVEVNNSLATAQFINVFPSQVIGTMNSPVRSERSDTDHFRITLLPQPDQMRAVMGQIDELLADLAEADATA